MSHEAGKGDAMRPTNHEAFDANFERIFGGKSEVIEEHTDDEPEDDICSGCSGSGEGMYDGSTCYKCKGCGVEPVEKDEDL